MSRPSRTALKIWEESGLRSSAKFLIKIFRFDAQNVVKNDKHLIGNFFSVL